MGYEFIVDNGRDLDGPLEGLHHVATQISSCINS